MDQHQTSRKDAFNIFSYCVTKATLNLYRVSNTKSSDRSYWMVGREPVRKILDLSCLRANDFESSVNIKWI